MNPSLLARSRPAAALTLLLGCLCLYSVTLTQNHLGYEGETIAQARGFLAGADKIEGRAGLLDVAFYLPFVAVEEALRSRGILPSIQNTVANFALPFEMALVALLVFLVAAELWGPGRAGAVALIFAFTTMAWPYSKMGMETTLALSTALALWGYVRESVRPGRGGYLIMAIACAGMLLTKVHAPLPIVLLTALLVFEIAHGNLKSPKLAEAAPGALCLLLCLGVFLWGNHLRYGRWFLSTSYSMSWETSPPGLGEYFWNFFGLLLSPGKSLFITSPPLVAAIFVLPAFCRRLPGYGRFLLVFVLPQIMFHAYFRTWADETWGPRRLVNLLPVLVLPLGMLFEPAALKGRFPRIAGVLAIALGLWMQIVAVSMNYASYFDAFQPRGLLSQENLAWNPPMTQFAFQSRLLQSCVSRSLGRGSLEFVVEPRFLPWDAPAKLPEPIRIDLSPMDERPDFWWAARRQIIPGWSLWGDRATYFVLFVLALGLVSVCLLVRASCLPPPGEPVDASG